MKVAVLVALGYGLIGCGRVGFTPAVTSDAPLDAVGFDVLPDAANLIGCADGTREGFADSVEFPAIAGCAASWDGTPSLRAVGTGGRCGYSVDVAGTRVSETKCQAPRDACAAGWHLCGETTIGEWLESGGRRGVGDLLESDCADAGDATATDRRFAIASSHSDPTSGSCIYATRDAPSLCTGIFEGGQPICCGLACTDFAGCFQAVPGWTKTPTMATNDGSTDASCRTSRDLSLGAMVVVPLIAGVQCCRNR